MHAYNPLANAATGSVAESALFLGGSVLALIGAVSLQLLAFAGTVGGSVAALFLVWLSGTLFTLGILEYRRSQEPDYADHGPEV